MQLESKTHPTSIINLELDKKVQFVYEIAFAKRELDGLGIKYDMKLEDTIRFESIEPFDKDLLIRRLAHFEKVGKHQTEYHSIVSRNIKRSDNQYLTHWYYPYKGKFHPRLVRSIFNITGLQWGQTILDPFVGSGTSVLEAHLFGLNSIGFDISPLTIIVSKTKVSAGQVADDLPEYVDCAVKAMKNDFGHISKRNFGMTKLIQESQKAYQTFLDSIEDERIRNFYLVAQLIFASDRGRRHRDFKAFEKNVEQMIQSAKALAEAEKDVERNRQLGNVDLKIGDSRRLPLKKDSVDGIITSPPYSIALNYMKNDQFALEELGIDIQKLSEQCIGVKGQNTRKLELYESDMNQCYSEMYRVLKPGGQCVVVIGDAKIDGIETGTIQKAKSYCEDRLGFKVKGELPKKIFGLYNTISDEKVIFLEKLEN